MLVTVRLRDFAACVQLQACLVDDWLTVRVRYLQLKSINQSKLKTSTSSQRNWKPTDKLSIVINQWFIQSISDTELACHMTCHSLESRLSRFDSHSLVDGLIGSFWFCQSPISNLPWSASVIGAEETLPKIYPAMTDTIKSGFPLMAPISEAMRVIQNFKTPRYSRRHDYGTRITGFPLTTFTTHFRRSRSKFTHALPSVEF